MFPPLFFRIEVRPFLAGLHRYLGLLLAGFLCLAGLTGTLLVFHHEIDAALNPSWFRAPQRNQVRLDADALAQAVSVQMPGSRLDLIYLDAAPGESIRIRLKSRDKMGQPVMSEAFLDPYDGRLLGVRQEGVLIWDRVHVMPLVFRLHQQLLISPPTGKWVTGAVALLWLLHSLTGFYLTLPRNRPFWSRWRQVWRVKRGASRARLEMDLHRAGGLWCWALLVMLAFSAVYLNLRKEVFIPAISWLSTPTPPVIEQTSLQMTSFQPRLNYTQAIATGHAQLPRSEIRYRLRYVQYLPERGAYRLAFEETEHDKAAKAVRFEQLLIDADTGDVLASRSYDRGTFADRLMAWQFPLHSGQVFGWPGRIVIALSGLLITLLSATGLLIWLRKRRVVSRRHPLPLLRNSRSFSC
ncbi:PepSY-associated TM helix domain-containing protein [Chitinimonas sp. BJB300]|uniref:PepSY-associated TM helix domain-containing protein n=1 Tax=Chitinimonas sp. BJB300 TaxID=1559339 RepID=UPI00130415A6|nr:PepSY-associated TM helix domain-containing protein [Chitinimonas sp. BJB300]